LKNIPLKIFPYISGFLGSAVAVYLGSRALAFGVLVALFDNMKRFKKMIWLISLFMCFSTVTLAQQNLKIDYLSKLILVNMKTHVDDDYWEKATVFSINIGVNKSGIVDTVIFSNEQDKEVNHLFDIKKIRKGLMGNSKDFIQNKNTYLVLLVFFVQGEQYFLGIKNGQQLIDNWGAIYDKAVLLKDNGRPQIFLPPKVISSRSRSIKESIAYPSNTNF
jgi:hypothetical protein